MFRNVLKYRKTEQKTARFALFSNSRQVAHFSLATYKDTGFIKPKSFVFFHH